MFTFLRRHPRKTMLVIILLAVLLRVGVALFLGDSTPPAKDETSYSVLAARLANGYGYSFPRAWYPGFTPANTATAHWSFLYTALVAAVYALVGVHPLALRLISALLTGILLPMMTYLLARRAFLSPETPEPECDSRFTAIPPLAAFLAAIYAYFILFGAMVQTEGLFIVATLWSLERGLALSARMRAGASLRARDGLWLGVSLGIAALLRQSILPWVVILFLWLAWLASRADVGQKDWVGILMRLKSLIVAGVMMLLLILPFTLRNYAVYGDFLLLNSNAGYAMYSSQHPMHGINFQAYDAAPLPTNLHPMPQNEAQWDRALMKRGIQFVLDEPGRYALLSLSRVADYFEFWPKRDSSLLFNLGRLLSFTLFLPFMFYGVFISFSVSGFLSRNAILYLFIAFYALLHILTWAMPRYRLPVDAVLILFAALAVHQLGGSLTRHLSHTKSPPVSHDST